MTPLVDFAGVGYAPSNTVILRDVDLSIEPGDVLGVSGPNGSGKTTLLRLLATLARPTSGEWSVRGITQSSNRQDLIRARSSIALIGHTPALWGELTLRENVEAVAELRGDASGTDTLAAVGLGRAAERRGETASLGMARRVEFARVLSSIPKLLLLDEAHAGLDAEAAAIVDHAVDRVVEAGGAAVLVSHETARLDGIVTSTGRIESGRLKLDS